MATTKRTTTKKVTAKKPVKKAAGSMSNPQTSQKEFPSLLYDTLYGLVLFFSLDSFLAIVRPEHFAFYLFTTVVVVHWWLMFKAAEDVFVPGVRDSAAHVFTNILYILLLEFMILYAQRFEYVYAAGFLLAVIALDFMWIWAVERAGRWKHGTKAQVADMRREMDNIIRTNVAIAVPLAILLLMAAVIPASTFVAMFIFLYVVYISLTFRYKIIDMRFF